MPLFYENNVVLVRAEGKREE